MRWDWGGTMPSVLRPPLLSLSLPERQTKEIVLFLPHHHHHHLLFFFFFFFLLLLLLLLLFLLVFLLDVSPSLTRARIWRPLPLTICSRRMVWRHQNMLKQQVKRERTRREPTEVTRKCPRCMGMTFLHPPPSTKSPKCISAVAPPIEKCSHLLPSRLVSFALGSSGLGPGASGGAAGGAARGASGWEYNMNDPTPPPPSLEMIENQRMMQVMILVRNFHEIWGFRAWFDIGASLPTIPPSAGKQRKPTITYTHAYA